ncbi:flagellar motor protein MotB [Pseudoalteromonas denitrificans]|uniref:Chemotaxis protein MotB n=1 Tax=Pseudoalteromonas denitrificans DSM 6059 TaxID=1123010 RepID=A0A1I1FEW5_9GAMM|nr:flagellar motor protein MotB [Pseudoalteromonas denitrificans]SFB97841.1 chemotaxis protein MotB [Pseudoalteromonas denitrificans DSM 6059]
MSHTTEDFEDEKAKGSPSWMTTFADLMSLLMCFFVLLLSYSEMDVLKFKQIAGSMKMAFGVQNQIQVEDIPKGVSVVADSFSPSIPEPTPIEAVQQSTSDLTQENLEIKTGNKQTIKDNDQYKIKLEQIFEQEIEEGLIEFELLGQQLIIRLKEQGSFPSGSSFLQPSFKPLLVKISRELNAIPGEITVSGHTDNLPVSNELHNNNWDLSAKRAAAILNELLKNIHFDSSRIKMQAFADNKPLFKNNSAINRSKNRRVEIAINQGKPTEMAPISIN